MGIDKRRRRRAPGGGLGVRGRHRSSGPPLAVIVTCVAALIALMVAIGSGLSPGLSGSYSADGLSSIGRLTFRRDGTFTARFGPTAGDDLRGRYFLREDRLRLTLVDPKSGQEVDPHGPGNPFLEIIGKSLLEGRISRDRNRITLAGMTWEKDWEHRPDRLSSRHTAPSFGASARDTRNYELIDAVNQGDVGRARALLAQGADVDARDTRLFGSNTPLGLASQKGDLGMVDLLLSYQATLDRSDGTGDTPLTHALRNGKKGVAARLIEAGARVDVRDPGENTTLIHAVVHGDAELISLLIRRGVEVNAINRSGRTALYEAVDEGKLEALELLLAAGADPNRGRSDFGSSDLPLMRAVEEGETRMVERLLRAGADPNRGGGLNGTARAIAEEKGYRDIAELLRSCGGR